jgi:hypothetical protein
MEALRMSEAVQCAKCKAIMDDWAVLSFGTKDVHVECWECIEKALAEQRESPVDILRTALKVAKDNLERGEYSDAARDIIESALEQTAE